MCYKLPVLFTGLIEDIGVILEATPSQGGLRLGLRPGVFDPANLALGESVAVDGCCLTVVEAHKEGFFVLCGAETLRATKASAYAAGARVNLERALRLGDRLGGHLVQGHVDGVGELVQKSQAGANLVLDFRAPDSIAGFIVAKGSIAIDGVSLTVNQVSGDRFSVALIPHTVEKTCLGSVEAGARVNLEADMIGKYVAELVAPYRHA